MASNRAPPSPLRSFHHGKCIPRSSGGIENTSMAHCFGTLAFLGPAPSLPVEIELGLLQTYNIDKG